MLRKKRIGRLRKPLALEILEDRTLLSGNVTVLFNAFGNNQLTITGDNGNNAFALHLTNNLGIATLSVTGSSFTNPIVPGNVTAINSIPGGTVNVPLGSVSAISITDGNGTNTILIGNGGPISIPGNISIVVGTDGNTVVFSNVSTSAGVISFTGTGSSADNVSMTNVVAGNAIIMTGNGNSTVSQTNVTFGTDSITTGGGNDAITITNSMTLPKPRLYAIGLLNVNSGGGNDTISLTNIDVGPSTIVAGTGNNSITFSNSLIQQASVTAGAETAGAVGKNTVTISNDTITGAFLNVSILNQSGVSGVLQNGSSNNFFFFFGGGTSPGSINTLNMVNDQFTGGGNLNVRVDDGVNYFNAGNNTVLAASTVLMELIDTGGNITVTLGDFFQSVMLGVGTVGLNDLDANNLTVSIGKGNDIVVVTAIVTESESVTIGDVSTIPSPPLPTPSVLINGTVGDNDNTDGLTIKLGTNANTSLATGWAVTVSVSVQGFLTLTGGDGIALNVTNTTVTGPISITLGSGGVNHFEAVTLMNVTSNDLSILVNSNAADAPDGVPAGIYINLINVNVTDTAPNMNNLSVKDIGHGVDLVNMMTVNVVYGLSVLLSDSRMNVLTAQNVTAAFGIIDGGPGGSLGSIYQDLGGNFGYLVIDFLGH